MNRLTVILISMALIARPGNGHLRLKKACKAVDPTTANRTIIPSAVNSLDCARASDANFFCNYVSFHGNECAIYTAACETTGGGSIDIYKVDPGCESGWYRFMGSNIETNWSTTIANCISLDAFLVAVSNAAEGIFLTKLLDYSDITNTTVWIGVGYIGFGSFFWWNGEPWGYLNWADGQPDYSGGVVSLNSVNGKWQKGDGSVNKVGVCEKALSIA